jgi:hypothetical protein
MNLSTLVAAIAPAACWALKTVPLEPTLENTVSGIPKGNHVKVRRLDAYEKVNKGNVSGPSSCDQVSDVLRLAGPDTSLAAVMWDLACSNWYSCPTPLPAMDGCLYVTTNQHLMRLFETVGRPNPCAFNTMFLNSFFDTRSCPDRFGEKKRVSRGGLVFNTCESPDGEVGFVTHGTTCARARLLQKREGRETVNVYVVEAVLGLPSNWERAALRRPVMTHVEAKEARATAKKKPQLIIPGQTKEGILMINLEFYSCGKKGALDPEWKLKLLIHNQMEALNKGFRGELTCLKEEIVYPPPRENAGIQFEFNAATDLHYIDNWRCKDDCDVEYDYFWKHHLHEEPGKIKVLLCPHKTTTIGMTNYPWDDPHGTMITADVMPGGGTARFDDGKTLVHELAHYFGLFHTFENCFPGDRVDDTNAEDPSFFGCPKHPRHKGRTLKTCITQPDGAGLDPVHNFMDYTDDQCMCGFTPGQVERMRSYLQGVDNLTPFGFKDI